MTCSASSSSRLHPDLKVVGGYASDYVCMVAYVSEYICVVMRLITCVWLCVWTHVCGYASEHMCVVMRLDTCVWLCVWIKVIVKSKG